MKASGWLARSMASVSTLSKPTEPGNGRTPSFAHLNCFLSWAGEWDDGCPVWVENLNRSEVEIASLHPDIRDKVTKALEACKRSQESGEVGLSRLDEHWKTDSTIQRSGHLLIPLY